MPFKAILTNLVEITPNASGAILADWEGESVEQFCLTDAFELKVMAAHKGIILNQFKSIQTSFPAGELQEIVITTETQHVIIGPVGSDYSLVLTLDRNSLVALALCNFNRTVQLLKKEIY